MAGTRPAQRRKKQPKAAKSRVAVVVVVVIVVAKGMLTWMDGYINLPSLPSSPFPQVRPSECSLHTIRYAIALIHSNTD